MPSSLIIVALAAAWLVVLVPMVARKRQAIARTTDSALAARVVRVGGTRDEGLEDLAMSDNVKPAAVAEDDEDIAATEADGFDSFDDELEDADEPSADERSLPEDEPAAVAAERRYRPGRGGFDPEAAEIAARAKYAHRQRIVLALIVAAVVTAALAGFLSPVVWWAHGAVDVMLVGYLGYLRRQVRIENEIRQRRAARLSGSRRVRRDVDDTMDADYSDPEDYQEHHIAPVSKHPGRPPLTPQRPPHRQAVVIDIDDEDPAFHELDEPGQLPYRRAAGE